ncbi:hypothetical protein LSAT2_015002 [Lamellibrachia satsuma]|nr:hypothetical protein LSAT2_015002 [Lamellibrachia satsuma]
MPTNNTTLSHNGHPSSSVHGLIWDVNTDTKYVKDVLVPIGCGITGALLIVILAYFWRNYCCRQKRVQNMPMVGANKQKKDHVMLLGDSSEDDDGGVPKEILCKMKADEHNIATEMGSMTKKGKKTQRLVSVPASPWDIRDKEESNNNYCVAFFVPV